jgi:hypothetical protein
VTGCGLSLDLFSFAFWAWCTCDTTYAIALHSCFRHAHHLVGDPVGFLFVWVVRLANGKLGLNGTGAE